MNIAERAIRQKTVSWMVIILLIVGGILSFQSLGRLEDPNFTIKQALILTSYPGASPVEVEEEITLPLENALQQLPYLKGVTSTTSAGLSQIMVEMKSFYRKDDLAQIWDEMRSKVAEVDLSLPAGANPPTVNTEFGDVYGFYIALTGEGYQYDDLQDYADTLRRELVTIDGVGKVSIGGSRVEQLVVEINRSRMTSLGLSVQTLQSLLQTQNLVSNAGNILIGSEYIRISSTGTISSIEALKNLTVGRSGAQLIYLSDIANITKEYRDPPSHVYHVNGQNALTLGISFTSGVNVVDVGETVKNTLAELEYNRPIGIEINTIYDQPAQVEESVDAFVISLGQAIAIVIVVLLLTMGLRPGVLMSLVLLLTILGTFIVMRVQGIELHRISLGALIIALGMLVDNAIVITEGIMIGLKRGLSRIEAAKRIVSHTSWPLLAATFIAITAFAPIGLSPDASGEFTGSLFWVLLISLFLSWVLAITITPFLCYLMFREEIQNGEQNDVESDPYKGFAYQLYRSLLHFTLRFRALTITAIAALFVFSMMNFGNVKQAFFPASSLPMFTVDFWLPEGSDIRVTESEVASLESHILSLDGVQQVTTTIGRGADRFMLTYSPEFNFPSYAQLLVRTDNFDRVGSLLAELPNYATEHYPQAFIKFDRMAIGPSTKAKIEARFIGPDPKILRNLGEQARAVFLKENDAINVRQDWRERSKVIRPIFNDQEARRVGISKKDLDDAIALNISGTAIGVFRHASDTYPIILRPPLSERSSIEDLQNIEIFSPISQKYASFDQVTDGIDLVWEDPLIKRRDRKRTLSVLADPNPLTGSMPAPLLAKLRPDIESIKLPVGYQLEWGGEYEAQEDANKAVFAFVPIGALVMFVVTVLMFNSIKQTLAVWITVPLAMIGVTWGLLITGAPFSFMALLAILSLAGMLIKNGIVLVEEIKRLSEEEGFDMLKSISVASVSRLRPVSMAMVTTVLGMIPLLGDVFFQPMAVTIMFGLSFATLLTLILVPVLFALFYGVRYKH